MDSQQNIETKDAEVSLKDVDVKPKDAEVSPKEKSESKIETYLSNKTLLVLGAASDISVATMQLLAKEGWGFHLAGRDVSKLEILAKDLTVRCGYHVTFSRFDASMSLSEQMEFWQDVLITTSLKSDPEKSSLAGVLCAIGYMGTQCNTEQERLANEQQIFQSCFSGLVPVLSMAASYFENKHDGKIIVISSVAGDRGRASNYPYGAAKAALTAYTSGLRARLYKSNVQVMTVIPGFVKTKMIAHLQTNPKLTASPEQVARDIVRGMHKNSSVIYSKWIWRYIMLIIKHIPESIFRHLNKL